MVIFTFAVVMVFAEDVYKRQHSNIYKFIRNVGGLCELGFFINGGDATINPHFDLCSKEINLVGSWVYKDVYKRQLQE